MAYPLAELQQADRQVRNGLIKSSAVAVVAAMVFAFFATQSLGRRLSRITEFAERVAAGRSVRPNPGRFFRRNRARGDGPR